MISRGGIGEGPLYNAELVRTLCDDIVAERDAVRAQQLISLLQAVIKDDQEEIRIRMSFLAKQYPITLHEPDPDALPMDPGPTS
jgi:hypothetical protein